MFLSRTTTRCEYTSPIEKLGLYFGRTQLGRKFREEIGLFGHQMTSLGAKHFWNGEGWKGEWRGRTKVAGDNVFSSHQHNFSLIGFLRSSHMVLTTFLKLATYIKYIGEPFGRVNFLVPATDMVFLDPWIDHQQNREVLVPWIFLGLTSSQPQSEKDLSKAWATKSQKKCRRRRRARTLSDWASCTWYNSLYNTYGRNH